MVLKLGIKDLQIIRTLYRYHNIPLSIGELANYTGFAWVTIRKHLEYLKNQKVVEEKQLGCKQYWVFTSQFKSSLPAES